MMKSLETQSTREAREQKRKRIIGISLLIIMVLSTAGYAFASFQGNREPEPIVTGTQLKVGDRTFALVNSKDSISSIDVPVSLRLQDYVGKQLYLDSNFPAGSYEIISTIGAFSEKIQDACYGSCDKNLPEKDCSSLMIILNSSSASKVWQNESCVFIEGDLRAVDAFIYKAFESTGG